MPRNLTLLLVPFDLIIALMTYYLWIINRSPVNRIGFTGDSQHPTIDCKSILIHNIMCANPMQQRLHMQNISAVCMMQQHLKRNPLAIRQYQFHVEHWKIIICAISLGYS